VYDDVIADLRERHLAGRAILPYPHPALRKLCVPVTRFDGLPALADLMLEVMDEANGVGLAAPQVGLPWRLFVMRIKGRPWVVANPTVTPKSGRTRVENEGCLSLPGLYFPIRRPDTVMLEAVDATGRPYKTQLSGLAARCVQHETDHLNGNLFVDWLTAEQTGAHPYSASPATDALEPFLRQYEPTNWPAVESLDTLRSLQV
jgi:peptide deformylase